MKRNLVPFTESGAISFVLVGFCLISTLIFAAPLPGTPLPAPKGKEMYSSRPKSYVPPTMVGPMTFEGAVPAETIVVEGPTATAPVPAPMPPQETMTGPRRRLEFTPQVLETPTTAAPNRPVRAPKEVRTEPIVINEHSEKRPISSVEVGPSATKPKGMAIPPAPPASRQPVEIPKREDGNSVLNFTPKKTTETPEKAAVAKPVVEPTTGHPADSPKHPAVVKEPVDDLDEFNARLAKIQLEKHQLDETLALIEKIKSPNHKVKTLVDLAEYVSRDVNYKREAETLYTLAVHGIEALSEGKPVVVKMPASSARPQPRPTPAHQPAPPRRPAPTLIEEKGPEPKPTPAVKPEPEPKPEPAYQPPLAPFTPTTPPTETKPAPVAEPVTPKIPAPAPPASRTPVLLDEEPEASSEKSSEKKEPMTVPSPAPPLTPSRLEPLPEPIPAVTPAPESTKRPNILLMDEPKTEPPKTVTPKEEKKPEPVGLPEATSEKKEETPAATPPKSTKRPMPGKGKRGVTLEAN